MAKSLTAFPSASGDVFVELDDGRTDGPARVGRGDTLEQAGQKFEEAVAGIRPIAESLIAQTTQLVEAPKSVEIRFGIKLSGEVGVILASSTAEAHVEVKLLWERDS